jgi:oligoribonuclease
MSAGQERLIWVDLEMTGLNPDTDVIIEIATVVTDADLTILAEGPVIAVHQSDEVLERMDDWNQRQHTQSGLKARVRASQTGTREAESLTLEFLRRHVPANSSPMCGNSVCQDRRFLYRHMPELAAHFHYRNLDVSTVKEIAKRWRPDLPPFNKDSSHLALEDIKDSIAELAYYRAHLFRPAGA